MAYNSALENDELLLSERASEAIDQGPGTLSGHDDYAVSGYEEAYIKPSPLLTVAKGALILAAVGWAGFVGYLFFRRGFQLPALEQIPYVATLVSMPFLLVVALYQLLLRSSIGEGDRFARIAGQLRKESEALDMRLAIVNQQLETARQTMREQAMQLEDYGASASINLEATAKTLSQHASTSAQQAEIIERAGLSLAHQFGQLIDTLPAVEERAKRISTTLSDGSEALNERVERLEARLDSLIKLTDEARTRTLNATQSLTAQLLQVQDSTRAAGDEVAGLTDLSANRITSATEQARRAIQESGATLEDQMASLNLLVERSQETLDSIGGRAVSYYHDTMTEIEARVRDLDRVIEEQSKQLAGMGDALTGHIDRVNERFVGFEQDGVSRVEHVATVLDDLAQRTLQLDAALQTGNRTAQDMIARSESLLVALDASVRELDEGHPAALTRLDDRIAQTKTLLHAITPEIEQMEAVSAAIYGRAKDTEELLSGQGRKLAAWLDNGEQALIANQEQVAALHRAIEAADTDAKRLTDSSGPQLVATLLRVKEMAEQAGERARHALTRAIAEASDELAETSEQALSQRLGNIFQARIEEVGSVADQAVQAAHTASDRLMRQLLTIADTTASIEKRIAEAEEAAETRDQDSFSRRSATLIEALNSVAIDVTKFLSEDVSDANWAAYLKGDRGVFTRRAVRLLNADEARSIAQLYNDNETFRESVNRYIHDFEAMLRNVLATREGSALGVTLLSSDIGKLYVALAQAIDRLHG
mgnify:CR=1 FL=1